MGTNLNIQEMQKRIDQVQADYREWLMLLPKLEAAQTEWQRAEAVFARLQNFYEHDYLNYFEVENNGLPLSLKTEGEESVLGEDTLFEAFGERHTLAMRWLKLAVKSLDNDTEAV